VRFVMERSIYSKWYLNWLFKAFRFIPISKSQSKQSLQDINTALKNGDVIALFPEGRLSRNGQLGKFHSGFERAAKESGAAIVPFYLRGLWGSLTSYATSRYKSISKVRMRHVSIHFGETLNDTASAADVKQAVFYLSIKSWREYTGGLESIGFEWLKRAKKMGGELCIADSTGIQLSRHKLLAAVMHIAKQLKPTIKQQQNIGILMPTSVGGVIANLSCLLLGKTLVNLNYTANLDAIEHAIQSANIKTIITSRIFLKKLARKGIELDSICQNTHCVYLEDYKRKTSAFSIMLNFILIKLTPLWLLKPFILTKQSVDDVAAILFSSGSEGKPKGIELTHRNLLGNAKQVSSVCNINDNDLVLSSLPLFHAFGLTVTTIMPLVEGTPFVCHPDPTDALAIGKLCCKYNATVLCGTSTFFGMYCRNKKLVPEMLTSLRFVIAGAEKLSAEVREGFKKKFGVDIYEGYGSTEVAPVASTNLPNILNPVDWHLHIGHKLNTVGLPVPGAAFRIVDPVSLADLPIGEQGMILIGGTQVMRGYLNNPEKTADVLINDGDMTWYKTGDKGMLDSDGFLSIVDRYSRFAKIGGEMVSLTQVEAAARTALGDDIDVMAITLPDPKKGEKIHLLYQHPQPIDNIKEKLTKSGINALQMPSEFSALAELPRLGSGKKDYVTAKKTLLAG